MWSYGITEGTLYNPQGEPAGIGYAGNGEYKNDPKSTHVKDHGPIPCGDWDIGDPVNHPRCGLYCLPLTPRPGTDTKNRAGFYMHGENLAHIGESSDGCPIQQKIVRLRVGMSSDRILRVVPMFTSTVPNPNDLDGQITLVV